MQNKLIASIGNQIEQIQSSIAMKKDEMGTELIDELTSEERDLLSRLNPEITKLNKDLLLCRNNRIKVSGENFSNDTFVSKNILSRHLFTKNIIIM